MRREAERSCDETRETTGVNRSQKNERGNGKAGDKEMIEEEGGDTDLNKIRDSERGRCRLGQIRKEICHKKRKIKML